MYLLVSGGLFLCNTMKWISVYFYFCAQWLIIFAEQIEQLNGIEVIWEM